MGEPGARGFDPRQALQGTPFDGGGSYKSLQTKVLAFLGPGFCPALPTAVTPHHMKPIRIALLALSLGAASCATTASETPEAPPALGQLESRTYLDCMKKANGRVEQAPCIQNEKAWQLKQLDLLHKQLAGKLNEEQRKSLAKSQAAWATFLESERGFATSVYYAQGGGSDLSVSTNEIRWIAQRRQQLQLHLDLN